MNYSGKYMKIAIDLNDVIRDYSRNFVKYYITGFNHEYDADTFELYTNEIKQILPFPSDRVYEKFTYVDFVYELFAKCPTCTRNLEAELNDWTEKIIPDLDTEENIELMFVSPMEYSDSIGCSYMFISKLGSKIRETYFPVDSNTIWDKCDVLITANPKLLETKPEGKLTVKIAADYNTDIHGDLEFRTLSKFIKDENNTLELIKRYGELH